MDKAYNIFIYIIFFGLVLYFLPKLSFLSSFGSSLSSISSGSIFGSSKVLLSFDSGSTFNEGHVIILSKFYSDHRGDLFATKDNILYKSSDGGSSWQKLDPIALAPVSILETVRNGKIEILRWQKH